MMSFKLPPNLKNDKNEVRKIGYEFEFSGIELENVAKIIIRLFDGTHKEVNRFNHIVEQTRLGDFKIEMDAALLKDATYLSALRKVGISMENHSFQESLEDLLEDVASVLIPCEIAAPPVPITEMDSIEQLRGALQQEHIEGTRTSFVNAFGLHINIEIPEQNVSTILNYLRAFFLLYDWIFKESEIDFSRRIPPFINEFPAEYIVKVLDSQYDPDLKTLVQDYFDFNPTRNRALDMFPIFASMDKRIFNSVINDDKTSPRPAFHYRLPNCLIDEANWRIAREWNLWAEVEFLANKHHQIKKLSEKYLEMWNTTIINFKNKWYQILKNWKQSGGVIDR
ncbi:amidoligase [candidate division KSB1 bacterium]|nr:amidoligase [candidate division KSB1 bacterium]